MSLYISIKCENLEVYTVRGDLYLDVKNAELAENVPVEDIVEEYGADVVLGAIGGFEDWLGIANVKLSEVAEFLESNGYYVEKN